MGTFLLVLAVAIEIFFTVWSIVTKDRHDLERIITRAAGVLLMVLLLLIGVLDGFFRYGLLLVILALQAGIGYLIWRKKKEKVFKTPKQIFRMLGNCILYTFALIIAICIPQHKGPAVTGEHEVITEDYTWVDESRVETYTNTGENRAVTIKVWYPKDPGNYPLVVFSHGSFGVVDSNTSTCTELASNGYVTVSIGHPYHAAYVKDTSGKVTIGDMGFINGIYADNGTDDKEAEQRNYEFMKNCIEIRTGDENFVLDTILEKVKNKEEGPFQSINPDKIGVFGHSMGGASSAEIGRQRSDIDAVIVLEGTMTGERIDCQNGIYTYNEEPYPVPILDMNSREVYDIAMALPETNGVTYTNFLVGEKAKDFHEVVINGVSHMNFCDLAMIAPPLAKMMCQGTASTGNSETNPRVAIETINSIILEYFNYYLKDSGELNLQSEYL